LVTSVKSTSIITAI